MESCEEKRYVRMKMEVKNDNVRWLVDFADR